MPRGAQLGSVRWEGRRQSSLYIIYYFLSFKCASMEMNCLLFYINNIKAKSICATESLRFRRVLLLRILLPSGIDYILKN